MDVYVRPPIQAFEPTELYRLHSGIATGTQVTSYKQMLFHNNGQPYRNIYLIAKPGVGKTTFCTHLSAVWCQAQNPDKSAADKFDDYDIQALRQYQLAFFIALREVPAFIGLREQSLCGVDEMVTSFIKSRLTVDISEKWLQKMLIKESCLIVLDGLDEWNHPKPCKVEKEPRDIPHQKLHNNYTVLTTTRSWKLDVIRLKPSEHDRRLDIHELDDIRLTELMTKTVKVLNRIHRKNKTADAFSQAIADINLGEICHTPYVRLQCLCLWVSDEEIGKSKCQIYANLIEATLARQRGKFQRKFLKISEDTGLPACFKQKKYCSEHRALLKILGKMAFNSIFNMENRQMLVMDRDFVCKYLTEEQLMYCLELGILTQNKDYGKVSARVSNVSFQHKSVHEFFVAFYVHTAGTTTSRPESDPTSSSSERKTVQDVIFDVCSDLSKILEISSVLISLSGLDSNQCSQIMQKLSTVVNRDSTCKAYRTKTDLADQDYYFYAAYKTMFNFQTLLTDCACEMKLSGEEVQSLPLEDIMINKRSKKAEHVSFLQSILQASKTNIQTLDIKQCKDTTEVTHIILFDMLSLRSLSSLEKLMLRAVAREQDVQQVLQQSTDTLRTFSLSYGNYEENTGYTGCRTELSEQCTDMILSMQLLQAVGLQNLILSHHQWERIVDFITSRTTMTQVWLWDITCRDHRRSCPGVMIDLSRHENLILLTLGIVPVSRLEVNSQRLQDCWIGHLPSSVTCSWYQSLPAAQDLHILVCSELSEDSIHILIETIQALLYLRQLHVCGTKLGDRRLSLSRDMAKLEAIELWKVTLTSESLRDLVDTVSHLDQSVCIWLTDCTVLPEEKYKAIKQEISHSYRYSLIQDGSDEFGRIVFKFRTVTEKEHE